MSVPDEYSVYCRSCDVYNVEGLCSECLEKIKKEVKRDAQKEFLDKINKLFWSNDVDKKDKWARYYIRNHNKDLREFKKAVGK